MGSHLTFVLERRFRILSQLCGDLDFMFVVFGSFSLVVVWGRRHSLGCMAAGLSALLGFGERLGEEATECVHERESEWGQQTDRQA